MISKDKKLEKLREAKLREALNGFDYCIPANKMSDVELNQLLWQISKLTESISRPNYEHNGYDLTGYPCPNCGRQNGNACYGMRIQCECGVLLEYAMAGHPNKWIKIK